LNGSGIRRLSLAPLLFLLISSRVAQAQGGPPYYTTDPGTPGPSNWEINLGYMPFLFTGQSIAHTPDVDINFGLGERIQLTCELAWLRLDHQPAPPQYGLSQDQLGVKWRFYDNEKSGLAISTFPQLSVNNPDDSVKRGITPAGASLLLPLEFTKKLGPVDVNWEVGYNLVHLGPDGWLAGLVVGHDVTDNLEIDGEAYGVGAFGGPVQQATVGGGLRYKIHPPFILLLMVAHGLDSADTDQPHLVGYFGMQFLLPPKPFAKD
jgi:hypothetical protein